MAVQSGYDDLIPVFQFIQVYPRHIKCIVADDLRGRKFIDLIKQLPVRIHFCNQKFSRTDICGGNTVAAVHIDNSHQVIIFRLIQSLSAGNGARRYHPDNLSLYKPFCLFWVFHLLCNGYLKTLLNQTVQIGIHCMIGNSAHGGAFLKATFLSGQRNLQCFGSCQGIIEKHFVKIAQTVKQDTVRIFFFCLHVMLHHGRQL